MENAQIETYEIEPVDTASTRWERWVRRFDNFVVAKGINNDTRIKAMMLGPTPRRGNCLRTERVGRGPRHGHLRCCERKTDSLFHTEAQH